MEIPVNLSPLLDRSEEEGISFLNLTTRKTVTIKSSTPSETREENNITWKKKEEEEEEEEEEEDDDDDDDDEEILKSKDPKWSLGLWWTFLDRDPFLRYTTHDRSGERGAYPPERKCQRDRTATAAVTRENREEDAVPFDTLDRKCFHPTHLQTEEEHKALFAKYW
ncbi:hypothetical protein STEG23_029830 [Scotinomys teguina]